MRQGKAALMFNSVESTGGTPKKGTNRCLPFVPFTGGSDYQIGSFTAAAASMIPQPKSLSLFG